jgi:hypothetical protein
VLDRDLLGVTLFSAVMPILIAYVIAVMAVAILCAGAARRRGGSPALVFVLQGLGGVAFGVGIVALLLDGYVEDYGVPAVESSATGVAALTGAAIATAAAWFVALRRRA